jgi:hypothetical protein
LALACPRDFDSRDDLVPFKCDKNSQAASLV